MIGSYDVGTDNLPEYIRVILSQTEGVNRAAVIHDIHYRDGGIYVEDVFYKKSRKEIDIIFKENILEYTGRVDLSEAYYKAIRKTGAYGWYRAKFRRLIQKI